MKLSFISYTDEIASCAGIKPSVLRLLLTDPPAGAGHLLWPLHTLPVPTGGTGEVEWGQRCHPDSVAADTEALENSGGG